jgi:hypothetical protein
MAMVGRQRKYWRDLRDTHRSRLVLRDSPEEQRKLDSGRKRWTTKWVAGELAIARRLLFKDKRRRIETKLAREG